MKHIMISIKPEYVCNILNKEKLLEIRKSIPKCILNGEECIVEIYCTKDPKRLVAPFRFVEGWFYKVYDDKTSYSNGCTSNMGETINGKVVAKWHLKDCEKFYFEYSPLMFINDYISVKSNKKFDYKKACLSKEELVKYAYDGEILPQPIYAWHIEDLHIYDTPKELAEFGLKRPFQSWGYLNNESVCD